MGDLSTREQIRGEAFRRIFNVVIDRCRHNGPWSQAWEACIDCHQLATDAVDALGDLLPTEIRCAAVSRDFEDFENLDHEVVTTRAEAAKELETWGDGGRLVGYYRTDWTEVTE